MFSSTWPHPSPNPTIPPLLSCYAVLGGKYSSRLRVGFLRKKFDTQTLERLIDSYFRSTSIISTTSLLECPEKMLKHSRSSLDFAKILNSATFQNLKSLSRFLLIIQPSTSGRLGEHCSPSTFQFPFCPTLWRLGLPRLRRAAVPIEDLIWVFWTVPI